MKLSHAHGATQDRWVMVERSDRMWSTGEGNGKPLQYSCLENPMNSMERQNDRILKEELSRSVQFRSVAQSCLTLCNSVDCSMPGFPVHRQLPKFTQTHVHWVDEAILRSHPTSVVPFSSRLQPFPASGDAFQMSQFFASGGQSIGVSASASVLPMNIQDWFPLGWTGWISL